MKKKTLKKASNKISKKITKNSMDIFADIHNNELKEMSLIDHLKDLRKRVITSTMFFVIAFLLCWTYKTEIYQILTIPLSNTLMDLKTGSSRLIYTKLTEGFTSYLKIVGFAAMLLSIPFFLLQIWLFISPALYKKERRFTIISIVLSMVLFTSGVIVAYKLVLPAAFKFFLSFQNFADLPTKSKALSSLLNLELEAKISEYMSLTMSLISAFGLAFQMPIVLILLVKLNMVTIEQLKAKRKYAIVLAFIFSAILTPPDIISQLFLAIPLYMLYELSLVLSKLIMKK